MVSSLGLTGLQFVGYDVGGYTGNPSAELYVRWLSIGVFTPLFRAHSSIASRSAEPWTFGEDAEKLARKWISLRYVLLPYIYTVFFQAT